MSLVVVGLSHRTVPLEILERMTVSAEHLPKALGDLVSRDFVSEAVILSTCHRTEIYVVAERFHGGVQDIRHFLTGLAFLPPEDFSDHLFTYHDEAAASHLFAVTAGLDSVVLGESQVLGQVRNAWERAREEGTAGSRLSALFRHALEVGKRVRSETAIGRGVTSLSQAAVAMATDRLGTLEGRKLVLLGAGEMGEGMAADLAASTDASDGDGPEVVVASRTRHRAVKVAEKVGGRGRRHRRAARRPGRGRRAAQLHRLAHGRARARPSWPAVMEARSDRPLLIVDMGMPRDIDPAVRSLPGVTLLDLADLQEFVEAGLDERRKEVGRVRAIVADEVGRFQDAVAERQAAPLVTALRDRAEELRLAELARYRNRLEGLDPRQQEAVAALTRSLLGKLLHEPTVRLKESAGSARGERLAEAIRELFDL